MSTSFISDLKARGLVNNITNSSKIEQFHKDHGIAYIGFDPSGSSLHLGNYIMLLVLRRLKQQGHKAIAVIGGLTGQIGDPSGKKTERVMLDTNIVQANANLIKNQIKKIAKVPIFNNFDIYKKMNMLSFLRDIGKLVNVNYLLEKDVISSRLNFGISYTEFSYNLIQGYDFTWLYKNKNITLQIGGSDQWGNITTGIEMIRKLYGDDNKACGLTINLLTKTDGSKFGKTEGGAIFLDAKRTSPFAMYQYLYNQSDADVEKLLKSFTLLKLEQIQQIMQNHQTASFKRIAQKKLAEWVVTDIHGSAEYHKCLKISEALFKGEIESLTNDELKDGLTVVPSINTIESSLNIIDLLIACNACASKSEARHLIESNAISVNNKLIDKFDALITKEQAINKSFSYIRKGKKNYFLINWIKHV